jgi:hypothetical protein
MQHARVPQRIPFAFMAITAAISTAFIFGLVATLSWQGCLMLMLVAAALTGGAVFTIQEMRGLGQEAPRIERSAAKTR